MRPPVYRKTTLEICTASPEDCAMAERGGADRVELNSALWLGGLTPSLGSIREARETTRLPLIVMIRPRPGGFDYSASEFKVMQRDAETALAEGADGIAFGILTPNGALDIERCRALARLSAGKQTVFHRAFDVVADAKPALEQLIELEITRVMTSGQEASAYNGSSNIAAYLQQAAGRIEVLPAGGISRFTVADVLERTGCDQIHASLSVVSQDRSVLARPQVSFGGTLKPQEGEYSVTDAAAVAALRQALP